MSSVIYIGLGAQKAGTSWIYKCLRKLPQFQHGFAKEYHVLSALNAPEAGYSVSSFKRNLERLKTCKDRKDKQDTELGKLERQVSLCKHPDAYFDYFCGLLSNPGNVTADISPSYAALNSDVLSRVRREFRQRGVETKIIFIMREPICRLESAIGMKLRKNAGLVASETARRNCIQKLKKRNNSPVGQMKGGYAQTVREIDNSFGSQDVFFGFYETFFSSREQERFADFLGVERLPLDSGQLVNSSKRVFKYPSALIDELGQQHQQTYDFVSNRFNFDLTYWSDAIEALKED